MKLLIDGDILVYLAGFAAEKRGKDVPLSHAKRCLTMTLGAHREYIQQRFKIKEEQIYITSNDKSNFRFDLATIQPYKGNRKASGKPQHFHALREILVEEYGAEVISDQEADDMMAIEACKDPGKTIIASKDKDLRMVPGWHWEMDRDQEPFLSSDPGVLMLKRQSSGRCKCFGFGIKWFWFQCIVGDRVDNIPGLPKMGDVTAYKALAPLHDATTLYNKVLSMYYLNNRTKEDLTEVGQLLWMRRKPDELWIPPED